MKCPKCHSDNPDNTHYCSECGTQLPPSEEVSIPPTKTVLKPPDELDIGSTFAGRYKIIELLGRGGMGVVYKAEDKRLKRTVALKFLPSELTLDPEAKERFVREAQAAARLDHSNICTVHEIDEVDGKTYIAMAYVDGQSLREKVKSGPLKLDEALDLGLQVTEGLKEAHKKGIVHRDIKSANIMVTEKGQAKIMDFGLAKVAEGALITKEAKTMGTVGYMSPEQARGKTVDHRTDIWSLGVVLYEMISGQLPFKGERESAIMYSIVHEEPKPIKDFNLGIPTDVEQVVEKAMAKNPEERYQRIDELLEDLKSVTEGFEPSMIRARPRKATLLGIKKAYFYAGLAALIILIFVTGLLFFTGRASAIDSIAVLPLKNLSNDPDQEYFTEGMHESLITELSKIKALKVISRTSVMRYKDSDKSLPEIAKELNVDAVVEGSALHEGERVRITVQLIDAKTDQHLWADKYDRDYQDILVLHSKVAQDIAQEIKVKLTPEEEGRLARTRPVNPEAHKAYLKGRYFWNKRTPGGIKKSIEYFQQATEIDPDYALPYAGLSDACFDMVDWAIPPTELVALREAKAKAREATRRALEIDDRLSEAHSSLATIRFYFDWDWSGAEAAIKRAIELNPNDALAHNYYSEFLSALGRHEEAIEEAKRAEELVPFSPLMSYYVGQALYFARQYDQANQQLSKTLEFNPDFIPALNMLGHIHFVNGRHKEGLAKWGKVHSLTGLEELAKAYAELEPKDAMHKWLELAQSPTAPFCTKPGTYALVYTILGEKDEAFKWLEKAYAERDTHMILLNVNPEFDSLRSDPRFQDLLERMNFPE